MTSVRTFKTGLLLIAGALFVVCSATAGQAQTANETSQLLNRIKQLENQVQTMSRALYRGETPPAVAFPPENSAGDTAIAANFEVRMSQIEDQQRKLTGQLEKITFDIQQVKDRLDRLQADTEQRFQQSARQVPAVQETPSFAAPATATTSGTLGTLSASGEGGNGPAEVLYDKAFTSIRDTQYDQAEAGFKQFLSQYPSHPLAANADYWLGETYYVRGDYKMAAKSFAQGYQDFPKSAKAADSLLKLGLSLSKMGKKDDACLSLRQLQQQFPAGTGPLQRKASQEIKELNCP